jgi:hypothetical protein
LETETESSLQNVVLNKKTGQWVNVQKHNNLHHKREHLERKICCRKENNFSFPYKAGMSCQKAIYLTIRVFMTAYETEQNM